MRFRLAVLTHGEPSPTLAETLMSFRDLVTPEPEETLIYFDGPMTFTENVPRGPRDGLGDVVMLGENPARGFCAATRDLWDIASYGRVNTSMDPLPEFVFWLEHDFRFARPVDLRGLATVLTANPQLAQVSLMRDAANAEERAAGGLFELRRDEFTPRVEKIEADSVGDLPWLEHSAYFTTTPSLMRTDFMAQVPFPSYPERCEGMFGIDLTALGYRFGVWGDGSVYVNHIGQRTGFGY